MAKGKVFEFISGMPPWGKAVVTIGTLTIVTIAGITVYKKINAAASQKKSQAQSDAVSNTAQSALDALATKNVRPTLLKEQYDTYANNLQQCFAGWMRSGANCYLNVFSNMSNDADVYRLIQAYGVRTVSSGFLDPMPDFKGDLSGIIANQLSTGEIADLNSTLSGKGITFQF